MDVLFSSWAGILSMLGLVVVLGIIAIKLWLIMRIPPEPQKVEQEK